MNLKLPFQKSSVTTPQEKRQQFLIVGLVVITTATLIVLYFGFWRSSAPAPSAIVDEGAIIDEGTGLTGSGTSGVQAIERVINQISFDISFLKDPLFESLKDYGEWPLEIGQKGRSNPFLSY